jgi:murein DD-endopeptidase MepM/ murein hydrolase activator NlpD
MRMYLRHFVILLSLLLSLSVSASVKNQFTTSETQQISIATPGLFDHSDAFDIDFHSLKTNDYSFPLPVGKAGQVKNGIVEISTKKGDAVKAMFDGVVRLSRNQSDWGNVIVVRHDNGLETVYGKNAQNLVKVGQKVQAGQTIAIVGGEGQDVFCQFSIMVNGGRINPDVIVDLGSHRLRLQTVMCKKNGAYVDVSVVSAEPEQDDDINANPFETSNVYKLDLTRIEKSKWSYPLPGSHVISPYGGRRNHAGVDIKTKPNDQILAAFDGVVTQSGPYFGYGNFIVIKHAWGLETCYSHQSKNLVKKGDKVKAGQVIGLTGRTGRATTEHLHFETHFRGHRFNPNIIFDHLNHALNQNNVVFTKKGSSVSIKKE